MANSYWAWSYGHGPVIHISAENAKAAAEHYAEHYTTRDAVYVIPAGAPEKFLTHVEVEAEVTS